MSKVAIIGYGYVGKAYNKVFPDAVLYDPYSTEQKAYATSKATVNACDMAIVAVPTDLKNGKLDISIVEDVVNWLETPLILIKSALQVGTTDALIKRTGKNIAVSVEMVGEGKYFIPYWKYPHPNNPKMHGFLIVGGEKKVREACANILWEQMSPDINIQLVDAIEAEIVKMAENTYGALKVTYANVIYDICQTYNASYIDVLQALGSDGRVIKAHMRTTPDKRGWKSKCYDKDVLAFAEIDASGLVKAIVEANKGHLQK